MYYRQPNESTGIGFDARSQDGTILSRPTESESFDDQSSGSDHSSDSEGGIGLQIAAGYLGPAQKSSPQSMISSINDEDRLIMLAKHPNATDQQVLEALYRQQQQKALKQQQMQEQQKQLQQQQQRVRFAQAFPVDADTGEAWDRQQAQDTSGRQFYGQAWESENTTEQYVGKHRQSFLVGMWRRLFPLPEHAVAVSTGSDSIVSRHDASISISMGSDKTPKISNIDEKARAKRIRNEMGKYTCGDRCENCFTRMVGTRRGLIVLGLVVITILASLVTVVAGLLTKSDSESTSSIDNFNGGAFPGGTRYPEEWFRTLSPTAAPTGYYTTAAPTREPTPRPTMQPTTAAPTKPGDTPSPTRFATPFPTTLPTLRPTQFPTLRPSTQPTSRPTLQPSESPIQPTPMPTVGFFDTQLQFLGAPLLGQQGDARFGQSISLSDDGTILAVGAPSATVDSKENAGIVQVFQLRNGFWEPRGSPLQGRNKDDQFGSAVALSADGSVLVATEPTFDGENGDSSGNVRAFVFAPFGDYVALGNEIQGAAATDRFGVSISLSANGRRLAVGAPYHDNGRPGRDISGQVTIYDYQMDGTWSLTTTLPGQDHLDWFGWEVDLTDGGEVLCVGAPRNLQFGGYVECYSNFEDGSRWTLMGQTIRNRIQPARYDDNFGHSVKATLSDSGSIRVAIGAPGKNADALDAGMAIVYQYDKSSDQWAILGDPVFAENPVAGNELGFAVDLQNDTLVVGIPGIGHADRYRLVPATTSLNWKKHPITLMGVNGSNFGYSIHQRGRRLAIGSAETPGESRGIVNVYDRR